MEIVYNDLTNTYTAPLCLECKSVFEHKLILARCTSQSVKYVYGHNLEYDIDYTHRQFGYMHKDWRPTTITVREILDLLEGAA